MDEESMSAGYFGSIFGQLILIGQALWADQDRIKLLKMDVRILEVFFMCLDTCEYMIDEESIERLRSMNLIWPKDSTLLYLLLERMGEKRPIDVCIQDFDSVMSELERLILQSKQQVEGWCRNSMMHSSMLQCKYSNYQDLYFILWSVEDIQEKLILSRYRTGENVSLKKQIDILRAKREFLEGNLIKVRQCRPDVKKILQFINFIGHFAISVACFTCLYWAKEDGNEIPSERDIVLFDMLQKFIPYAYDITPLYIGILKSDDLHLASDMFLLGEAVESFVDFFFEHLATVLKDDFLFLRDRLMFLFMFLTDPPCENAEEGDLIRSQIYAILHEDAYLHLSFDEMNKDLCDKKALLSGCMTRIDIANANIRQLYRGSSGSQITLEVAKMEYDYFASVHKELSSIEKHVEGADKEQLQLYIMELRFLRVFLLCFATWDDTDDETKVKLRSMITSFRGIWGEKEGEGLLAHRLHAIRTGSITDWHPLAFELRGKIQQSKLETEAWCLNLFRSSFQLKTSTSYTILEFLDSMLDNLNHLVRYKASEIIPFKKQIETLEEKLMFLNNFLKLAVNCKYCEELGEFKMFVQAFANEAACLTFLYWAKDVNAKSASETNCILSHMLRKIKPATPDVARLYFGTLMAIYVQPSDSLMFGQTAFSFVQLFLEDLVTHLKDDDFQIFRDNSVFLLTFLNDPPDKNAEEWICSQIDVLFLEGLYGLLPFDDMGGGFPEKKLLLNAYMMKIEAINANIRCIYGKFPDSSLYNFPKVISPQFLDFLLQNLRNLKDRMNSDRKYVPFAKYRIIKIEEELVSFCPFFNHIFVLQSELKDTWLEVVNVLHLTEHVIMSCISSLFVFDHPFWYHMAYLSDVFDEIKVVKAKLEMIKLDNIMNKVVKAKLEMIKLDNIMNNARYLPPSSVGFSSEINEIVVGFEDEKETIIGMLTRGPKSLDIVSIVGMGGLGKTTLAKKVLGSSSVKCHFVVFAFCSVSQDHNARRLLLDIIHNIKGGDGIIGGMTNDDLAHLLWKCLSGQKYLVVLDDIWNVKAWNEVKRSFPDNQNGSRVMFTTRWYEVAVAEKSRVSCSPHRLRFLTEVESWELLQKKVFRNGISPPYLDEIGKQIAKNCKGLALAVVVIGGLLARTEKSLSRWSEVAKRLVYYLSKEGCMEILELSYKHLPENLKPCLMYLGAFPEDSLISVKHVILLWISEGFVQESKEKSLEDVAKEYFDELVDRSLIIVSARSSSGGIKTFHVHDLIHELCETKCRDGYFFQLNHESASSASSSKKPSMNNHYRLSTQKESDVTIAAGSSLSDARTIHFFGKYSNDSVPLRKLRLVQVLDLGNLIWEVNDINQLTSMIHLRYINAILLDLKENSIPWSISDLWNITSLTLRSNDGDAIHLPETFWRLKSLRHVNVCNCILKFLDDDNHEADLSGDQILDKVVSFSNPILYTGKDVKRLLQRLPVVRNLSCALTEFPVYDEETLDFYVELESLTLQTVNDFKRQYIMMKFPSTLKKLTLEWFLLPWTALSSIAQLQCLEVLKLRYNSFGEQNKLETEDLVFQNLKFFQLRDRRLEEWNASPDSLISFPLLEQLVIHCEELKELPPCFGEMSTLRRIAVHDSSPKVLKSALRIQEELMELGTQLEVSILKSF